MNRLFAPSSLSLRQLTTARRVAHAMPGKPVLSFKQFLLRQEILRLYREWMKTAKALGDSSRDEVKDWAREAWFSKFTNLEDEEQAKHIIRLCRNELKSLQSTVILTDPGKWTFKRTGRDSRDED
ncbi:hypothetical protein M427DRAFT_153856 [Gonapodya prolifera JEL478]|uniref:Complex 1 LYR protein domain-containing protein n=1 Tax=Gonapodya prolifera (strain JEL478) TaxID=1344416 RepID=A0A139AKQ2_GONPJ|nr:hypothetical protein M427DRAFT_153856 [Gonapodya prolifera JEL478]|eukprot:KXS17346.1 hypothetical protein M427DRAFT_153856 [Gonapodya prolifera JEL478]